MEQFLLLILIIPIFFSFSLLHKLSKQERQGRNKNLPPGPWRLPILGNLHQIGAMPHQSLLRLSLQHGPLMLLRLGRIPTLVISSGQSLQSIIKSHDAIFSGRPALDAVTKLSFDNSNISFAPYGEKWRNSRKVCVRELLSARRVRAFQSVREEETAAMIEDIEGMSSVNLSERVFGLTYNVLCRVVFGGVREGFGGVMAETQRLAAGFCAGDLFPGWGWVDRVSGYWGKVEGNFAELDRFFDGVIEEHLGRGKEKEEEKEEEDLVDVLLGLLHGEDGDGGFVGNLNMNDVKGILAGKWRRFSLGFFYGTSPEDVELRTDMTWYHLTV